MREGGGEAEDEDWRVPSYAWSFSFFVSRADFNLGRDEQGPLEAPGSISKCITRKTLATVMNENQQQQQQVRVRLAVQTVTVVDA